MDFKLPPLPNTLGEILQIVSRETPYPDNDRLAKIIQRDPAMTVYVLRQVNSAYYGVRQHVTQIRRAVALLGLKRICNLVLAAALKQTFSYLEDSASQTIYQHIMRTSVATAALARDLAVHLHFPFTETAFTAGLLHQLGRLVFLYSASDQYIPLWYDSASVMNLTSPEVPSVESEQTCFDTDHLQIGASTLQEWGLPEEFVTITGHLHTPEQVSDAPLRILTHTVAASSAISATLFTPNDLENEALEAPEIPPPLMQLAQAQHTDVHLLTDFLETRTEDIRQFAQTAINDT